MRRSRWPLIVSIAVSWQPCLEATDILKSGSSIRAQYLFKTWKWNTIWNSKIWKVLVSTPSNVSCQPRALKSPSPPNSISSIYHRMNITGAMYGIIVESNIARAHCIKKFYLFVFGLYMLCEFFPNYLSSINWQLTSLDAPFSWRNGTTLSNGMMGLSFEPPNHPLTINSCSMSCHLW